MPFKLTILGCNSAIPTIDKYPTSQLLNVNERFFLIDCGEGTQIQFRRNGLNFQRINHIFISHLHGDHYFGLIGLVNTMHLLGRKKELHIYSHKLLKNIIDLQMEASSTELRFPLFFHEIPIDKEEVLYDDKDIRICNLLLDHSISCSGFLFKEKKPSRTILKEEIIKYNIPFSYYDKLKSGKDFIDDNGNCIKNNQVTVKNSKPHSYAFCSDTRFLPDLINKISDVDLLYHEATFKGDLKERALETGHSTTFEAATIAKKANVNRLLIGHYSQRYKNLEELKVEAQTIFPETQLAYPGLNLDFKDFM
ncbi:MAG: ribonuclease Z [Bacteroidota bacterium]|nr:ribonuclease Z [Bacteroidota bacterium]